MQASESPYQKKKLFQSYKWKRILSFTNLICSSVSGPKPVKKCVCVLHTQFRLRKVMERFRNSVRKMWNICTKNRSHWKNISKEKNRRYLFVVYVLICPLSKFGGNRTNSLWVLALDNVRYKWKNWFEKTALNMSIRRVIFTSCQNLKLPLLCQYFILFNDFFFTLEISVGSLL